MSLLTTSSLIRNGRLKPYASFSRVKMTRSEKRFLSVHSTNSNRSLSSVQVLRQDYDHPHDVSKKSKNESAQSTTKDALHPEDQSPGSQLVKATNEVPSPSELTYTGGVTIPITSFMHIVKPQEDTPSGVWPIFRLMVRENLNITVALYHSPLLTPILSCSHRMRMGPFATQKMMGTITHLLWTDNQSLLQSTIAACSPKKTKTCTGFALCYSMISHCLDLVRTLSFNQRSMNLLTYKQGTHSCELTRR
jgi:hypothetical protein